MGPDGKLSSEEGFVLKRMLLEKGQHVLQAGIRCDGALDVSLGLKLEAKYNEDLNGC